MPTPPYPRGNERVTYTNMRPRGRGATRGTGTRRFVKVRSTGETPSQSDASEMWDELDLENKNENIWILFVSMCAENKRMIERDKSCLHLTFLY